MHRRSCAASKAHVPTLWAILSAFWQGQRTWILCPLKNPIPFYKRRFTWTSWTVSESEVLCDSIWDLPPGAPGLYLIRDNVTLLTGCLSFGPPLWDPLFMPLPEQKLSYMDFLRGNQSILVSQKDMIYSAITCKIPRFKNFFVKETFHTFLLLFCEEHLTVLLLWPQKLSHDVGLQYSRAHRKTL